MKGLIAPSWKGVAAIMLLMPLVLVRAQSAPTTRAPSNAHRAELFRATMLEARGEMAAASDALAKLADAADAPSSMRQAARRRMIALRIASTAPTSQPWQRDVDQFAAAGAGSVEIWNCSCRLLIAQLRAARPEERAQIWKSGLARLESVPAAIETATMGDIDGMLELSSRGGSLRPLDLLTDLILLTPDSRSLRQLLSRRCDILSSMGDAQSVAVARTLVLLSACSDAPLLQAVAKLRGLESPKVQIDRVRAIPTTRAAGGKDCLTRGAGGAVDQSLERAARNVLENAPALPARRRAYLCMFAQRPQESIASAWLALSDPGQGDWSDESLSDLLGLSAACGGDFERACRVASRIGGWTRSAPRIELGADSQPAEQLKQIVVNSPQASSLRPNPQAPPSSSPAITLAVNRLRLATEKWSRRAISAVERAYQAGDDELALGMFMRLIEAEDDPGRVRQMIDQVAPPLSFSAGAPDVHYAALIGTIEPLLIQVNDAQTRRSLLIRLASMQFAEGQYEQCDATARRAEEIRPCSGDSWDAELCITRGLALLKADRFDLATAQFQRVAQWDLPNAERARAGFLWGFALLQSGDEAAALAKLRDVVDAYPKTPFAAKARELIGKFEEL